MIVESSRLKRPDRSSRGCRAIRITKYVAMLGGSIVGTFALLIMDNLAHMGAPSGVLEDVVVHRDWRGKGVGKQMVQFAMDRCGERGCYKLALSSNLKRKAAHRFYDDLGFQRHGYSFVVQLNHAEGPREPTVREF